MRRTQQRHYTSESDITLIHLSLILLYKESTDLATQFTP